MPVFETEEARFLRVQCCILFSFTLPPYWSDLLAYHILGSSFGVGRAFKSALFRFEKNRAPSLDSVEGLKLKRDQAPIFM